LVENWPKILKSPRNWSEPSGKAGVNRRVTNHRIATRKKVKIAHMSK